VSKRGAEQTVDNEVTRRVDDDEDVAQLRVVEMKATTVAVSRLEQSPEDLIEKRRSLTDDEDADDGDDTLGDVVVLATFSSSQLRRGSRRRRRPASDGVQRADELDVEIREAGQRHQVHDWVVQYVAVDDLVDLVVAEDQRFTGFCVRVVVGGIDSMLLSNHLHCHSYHYHHRYVLSCNTN